MEQKAQTLLDRYLKGECSPSEKAVVERAYATYFAKKPFVDAELNLDDLEVDTFKRIHAQIQPKVVRLFPWKRMVIAASIFLIAGLGSYLYLASPQEIVYKNDVLPGGNRAYLTLSSGKRIAVDSLQGEIALEQGVRISKNAAGELIYEVTATGSTIGQNVLETPKGGLAKLVLPDGTKVWLNAASSLKYPASFASLSERRIELIGEAYFEVAKVEIGRPRDRETERLGGGGYAPKPTTHNSQLTARIPFFVRTKNQEVAVLGTHFNVNAYSDEAAVKTTLLEGSVEVRLTNGKAVKLMPGQQADVTSNEVKVNKVDTDVAMAWKNGEFTFNNEPILLIMQRIAKWYNVEVVFEDEAVKSRSFWGTVSRYEKVSEVLKVMERTNKVHFEIEGRKITVKK